MSFYKPLRKLRSGFSLEIIGKYGRNSHKDIDIKGKIWYIIHSCRVGESGLL